MIEKAIISKVEKAIISSKIKEAIITTSASS